MLKLQFKEERACIGGPLHGRAWHNAFVSFVPAGYIKDTIFDNGAEFMQILAHESIAPGDRVQRWWEWFSGVVTSVQKTPHTAPDPAPVPIHDSGAPRPVMLTRFDPVRLAGSPQLSKLYLAKCVAETTGLDDLGKIACARAIYSGPLPDKADPKPPAQTASNLGLRRFLEEDVACRIVMDDLLSHSVEEAHDNLHNQQIDHDPTEAVGVSEAEDGANDMGVVRFTHFYDEHSPGDVVGTTASLARFFAKYHGHLMTEAEVRAHAEYIRRYEKGGAAEDLRFTDRLRRAHALRSVHSRAA